MISVNLLPPDHSVAIVRARRICIWAAVCMVEAAGLGLAGWILTPAAGAEQRAWSRFTDASDRLRATNAQLAEETARQQKVTSEARTAKRFATARAWSPLLAFLAERTPPEVMLTMLRAQVPVDTVAAPKAKPVRPAPVAVKKQQAVRPDRTLILRGHAVDHTHLARFMRVLNNAALFRSVRLDGAERKPFLVGQAIDFSLTCRW